MKAIISQTKDPGPHVSEEGIDESIYPYYHEVNITEGGEFLDDSIRTKDQPLAITNPNENGDS